MNLLLRSALIWVLAIAPALAADTPPLSPQLQALDIGVGTWTYHGTNLQTPYTKAGSWMWDVKCSWSANRIYLLCSFVMSWPEGPDHSVSISTYNKVDKAYWHYEIIDDYKGDKPVISRMTVSGNTWIETTENVAANGKTTPHFRVVYEYTSPTRVEVKFQTSKDATHWTTLGQGEGIKQSPSP
jgi:hypothetical protein